MSVRKIFTILIVVVVCIALGALVLNVLMPNAVNQAVNTIESGIYKATGLEFDLNGDGKTGKTVGITDGAKGNQGDTASDGVGVEGFQ